MRDAFRIVDSSIDDDNFLAMFKASGCYLIDLCREPVDQLDSKSRRIVCGAGERLLSRRIVQLRPPVIATLLRSIEGNVARAILQAGWSGPLIHLPYPGRWSRHRAIFVETLAPTIRGLMQTTQ